MDKLISVIVPVYQVEPYLDECVRSIAAQTYEDLEIILVDDGSPDRCPAMCDAWAERDRRIRVIHKPNGGLSDARNAGLAAATGAWIAFVDSDDRIAPEMLEKLADALERDDSDIAACAVEMVWEDDTPARLLTAQVNCVLERAQAQAALMAETTLKQPVWYKLYRAETIRGIPFEVGKTHEDVFWSYQAVGRARRVSVIDYVGYYYLQRSGSIMGSGYSLKRLDAIEAYELREKYISEHFPELDRQARMAIFTSSIYHGQMAVKYLPKEQREKAMSILREAGRRSGIRHVDYAHRKAVHRIWLDLARISLGAACRMRNLLGVGI